LTLITNAENACEKKPTNHQYFRLEEQKHLKYPVPVGTERTSLDNISGSSIAVPKIKNTKSSGYRAYPKL
jgi:hypothetical protein